MGSLMTFTITLLLGAFIGVVVTSIVSKSITLEDETELWEYRETGLKPEQVKEMDKLYLKKCEEVNQLQKDFGVEEECSEQCLKCKWAHDKDLGRVCTKGRFAGYLCSARILKDVKCDDCVVRDI